VVDGAGQAKAFWNAYQALQRRIELFLAPPLESIDRMALANRLREIGKAESPVD